MKIASLVLNNFTNDARVHKTALTLAQAGHAVTVIALWKDGLLERQAQAGYQVIRIRLSTRNWRGGRLAPLIKYIEFAARVWGIAGKLQANIYHANDGNTLPAAWLAMRRSKAHLVYDAHELETGRNFGSTTLAGFYRNIWAWPEKTLIHRASAVITASHGYARELTRLYGINPAVVLNCPEIQAVPRSDRLRAELGIPEKQKIVLYQGQISAGRGIEPLFAAVQGMPDVCAVALGDGPAFTQFRARVDAGEWQRVYLPGKIPLADLLTYTASADIGTVLIQPTCLSYRLTTPNKLFEYMHAGIPILGADLPEIGRIIRETGSGEVCDPEDPTAIAAALNRLLSDPARYAQAKANASQSAALYNWENESRKLLEVYQRMVDEKCH